MSNRYLGGVRHDRYSRQHHHHQSPAEVHLANLDALDHPPHVKHPWIQSGELAKDKNVKALDHMPMFPVRHAWLLRKRQHAPRPH